MFHVVHLHGKKECLARLTSMFIVSRQDRMSSGVSNCYGCNKTVKLLYIQQNRQNRNFAQYY